MNDSLKRRRHALLVEDDPDLSVLTREMLSSLGFAVTHVESAAAALAVLSTVRPIDVVLTDIMLPGGVNGVELAREIRRRHPGLPVLLTTGFAKAAAALKEGEFTLLLKPVSLETLAAALGVFLPE